jgi:hypothetical protein
MRKIRDVLRYRHTTDLSLDAIAGALRLSKGVVAKYLKLATSAGRPNFRAQSRAAPTTAWCPA